jgi:hypothetical protein
MELSHQYTQPIANRFFVQQNSVIPKDKRDNVVAPPHAGIEHQSDWLTIQIQQISSKHLFHYVQQVVLSFESA